MDEIDVVVTHSEEDDTLRVDRSGAFSAYKVGERPLQIVGDDENITGVISFDSGYTSTFDQGIAWIDDRNDYKSTFIPYWSPQPPASTDMKDVYINAYKRSDGRALLVVGNTSREPRSGTLTLNAKSLGLTVGKVLSWPDGKPLAVKNDTVEVSMEGLYYRLLVVGDAPA